MSVPVGPPDPPLVWPTIARRIVEGVNVQPGELVLVRDGAGEPAIVQEVLLAVEVAGAMPLLETFHAAYLERRLAQVAPAKLARWDHQRMAWARRADRVVRLAGAEADFSSVPPVALRAWEQAIERLRTVEEERRQPVLMVAVPSPGRAQALGLTVTALAATILPCGGSCAHPVTQDGATRCCWGFCT